MYILIFNIFDIFYIFCIFCIFCKWCPFLIFGAPCGGGTATLLHRTSKVMKRVPKGDQRRANNDAKTHCRRGAPPPHTLGHQPLKAKGWVAWFEQRATTRRAVAKLQIMLIDETYRTLRSILFISCCIYGGAPIV